MHAFTRRSLLQGGTALATAGALTGPALLEFAKAWAQSAPWKAEPGAKLTVMRWKRFVPAEDDAFNAMVAAFKGATGTEMNVFSESFEDVQPKASVAANTGSGLDLAWGLHTLPQLFPTKVLKMNDVADYLGKKYGGWTDAAARPCKQGNDWLGIPVATVGGYMTYRKSATDKAGFKDFPKDFPGFLEMCKALKANNTPAGFALGHAGGDANGWLHWVLWGHGAYTVHQTDKVIINSPETAKAFIAFMLEKENFEKWLSGARGYLTHTLNAYDTAPVWTADPKNAVFAQASKRALPASGIGTPGEKAATAIADFLVVDMFANYCTGTKDAKSAISDCERQLKRIYR